MFETFKTKGLNNLIWVWTSQTDDYDWYPGDDYVDIIGCDIYNKGLTAVSGIYDSLTDEFPDKLITLSEFGNIAGLSDQWDAGIKWSWTMPWYDYNRTVDPSSAAFNEQTHIHADLQYWEKALENDYVITRDQMPSLK
jgi:mannan endo-1,4-beta-mannosidase